MSVKQTLLFWLIVLCYLCTGVLYAVLTPAWQAPDEPAHYNYVRYLAEQSGFPELVAGCYDQLYLEQLTSRRFPPELSIAGVCYEYHQPPLYYGLISLVYRLAAGQLIVLRLFSVLLGAGVVILAFFVGKTIFPQQAAVPYGVMAFVAFVPMHLSMLASVNNDALAELIFAAILLQLVRRLVQSEIPGISSDLLMGGLLGLGFVTKTTVYIAVPLVAIALWFHRSLLVQNSLIQLGWLRLAKQAVIIYGLALGIALPWYVRNSLVYGGFDILGLGRHDQIVLGQLRAIDFFAQVGGVSYAGAFITTTFHSFWGQFGWMAVPMDGRTYGLLLFLTALAVAGLVIFACTAWLNTPLVTRRQLQFMGLTILFALVAYLAYNVSFVQLQGRYLFPGLIPLGVFFTVGLGQILHPRWGMWLIGLLLGALGWEFSSFFLGNGLDKWAVFILGCGLGAVLIRQIWPQFGKPITIGLLLCCYAGLGFLALVSPFWYILPYL